MQYPSFQVATLSSQVDPLVVDAPSVFPPSCSAPGIGIGPPGESSFLAVNTSTPVSVTSRVCSNCADGAPVTVTLVQSSGQVVSREAGVAVIIGSMVKVIPGANRPTALFFA